MVHTHPPPPLTFQFQMIAYTFVWSILLGDAVLVIY